VTINKTGSFRHTGTFSFVIDRENDVRTLDQCTLRSDDGKTQLFLDGIIYNKTRDELLVGFHQEGATYVTQLEGSFVIFLKKDFDFYIITDKVNSRKAYYISLDGDWYISKNIDLLPKGQCQLSLDGLACYLANGVMLNDLTLFQGIKSSKRAGIHCFKDGEHTCWCYWDFKLMYTPVSPELEVQLQKESEQLFINCVKRRYDAASHPSALSLSAGYDSRGILGIFHKYLNVRDISCFSYATDDHPKIDTDAELARKLAETCTYEHKLLKSYDGDLIALLKSNAMEGQCLSYFCEELDGWHSMADSQNHPDIFVGDQSFGLPYFQLQTNAELLASVGITDSSAVEALKGFLPINVYHEICHSIDRLSDDLVNQVCNITDPLDKQRFLHLDQRVNHFFMPWREQMTGQAGFVHNPYLDGEILDFFMRVPPEYRKDKKLFKKSISNMLPDLFSIPIAKSSGYSVNWQNELVKHRNALIELIQNTDSLLDEFISKDQMIAILNAQGSTFSQMEAFIQRGIKYLRRKYRIADQVLNILLGPGVFKKGGFVSPEKLMIRLLLMRIYLSPASSKL
jgi:asparagine synthase (glutamine-hydrolysing)